MEEDAERTFDQTTSSNNIEEMEPSEAGSFSSGSQISFNIDSHSVINDDTNSEWASSDDGHDNDNSRSNASIDSPDNNENRVRSNSFSL